MDTRQKQQTQKKKGQTRTLVFKIVRAKRSEAQWRSLQSELRLVGAVLRRLFNWTRQRFLAHHVEQGSHVQVAAYLDGRRAETKPTFPIGREDLFPREIVRGVRRDLGVSARAVHGRILELADREIYKILIKSKATDATYSRWIRNLSGEGEDPARSKLPPIPFDKKSGSCGRVLIAPADGRGDWQVEIGLLRDAAGAVIRRRFTLDTRARGGRRGRKLAREVQLLWRILDPHPPDDDWCEFRRGQLVLHTSDWQWYAHLVVEIPRAPRLPLDPKKAAVLRAGRRRPWLLRVDGHTIWIGGPGGQVASKRKQLAGIRRSARESYRSNANKRGRGRKHGFGELRAKTTGIWKNFTKTFNQAMAIEIEGHLVRLGVGALIYVQPKEGAGATRFLETAGRDGSRDPTGWEWYGMKLAMEGRFHRVQRRQVNGEKTRYSSGIRVILATQWHDKKRRKGKRRQKKR